MIDLSNKKEDKNMFGKKRLAEAEELMRELDERKSGIRKNPDGQPWYNSETEKFLLDFNEDQKTFLRYALQKELENDQRRAEKISQMSRKDLKQYREAQKKEDTEALMNYPGSYTLYNEAYRLRELCRPDYLAYTFLDARDMVELYRIITASNGLVAIKTINVTPKHLYDIIHCDEKLDFLPLIIGGGREALMYENYMDVTPYFEAAITQADFKKIDFSDEAFEEFVAWLKSVRECYHNRDNTTFPCKATPSFQQMRKRQGYSMDYYFSTKAFMLIAKEYNDEYTENAKGRLTKNEMFSQLPLFPGIDFVDKRIEKAKKYIRDKATEYMKTYDCDFTTALWRYYNSEDIKEIDRLYRCAAQGHDEYRSILIYRQLNDQVNDAYIDANTYNVYYNEFPELVDDIFNENVLAAHGKLPKKKRKSFGKNK